MKTLELDSQLDSQKKLMAILFWTNRKTARTEGCAPFLIKKISTEEKTYTPEGRKLLKLTDEIMDHIIENIDNGKPIEFEISMGKEFIRARLEGNIFSVSTEKSGEIEDEIIEKLETELTKKYPSVCASFKPRVTPKS
jgi:hypothetical protein